MNKLFLISVMVFATLSAHAQTRYPAAPKDNTVDEYFGVKVADPFRPLENDTAELTAAAMVALSALSPMCRACEAVRTRSPRCNNER